MGESLAYLDQIKAERAALLKKRDKLRFDLDLTEASLIDLADQEAMICKPPAKQGFWAGVFQFLFA